MAYLTINLGVFAISMTIFSTLFLLKSPLCLSLLFEYFHDLWTGHALEEVHECGVHRGAAPGSAVRLVHLLHRAVRQSLVHRDVHRPALQFEDIRFQILNSLDV